MEPVEGVKNIQPERWNLLCCVCKQRMGAKIQCTTCYTAYHPLCARIAGAQLLAVPCCPAALLWGAPLLLSSGVNVWRELA